MTGEDMLFIIACPFLWCLLMWPICIIYDIVSGDRDFRRQAKKICEETGKDYVVLEKGNVFKYY